MVYYYNGSDVVTNVNLEYKCCGIVHTYPDYENLSESVYDTYTHIIPLFKASPESGVSYSFSRPYSSDRVIQVSPAAIEAFHVIDFSFYRNGSRIENSVSISDNGLLG